MALETITTRLVGIAPLLMHSSRLANPRDEWTRKLKDITSRRKKTDADHEEIQRIEWFGSLYTDEEGKVAMPSDNVLGALVDGAKKRKQGEQAKAGVYDAKPFFQLDYPGPKEPVALWDTGKFCDYRSVVVQQSRCMRSRPIFRKWTIHAELLVDAEIISVEDVLTALRAAGERCGIGDFTPRYGRFSVEA